MDEDSKLRDNSKLRVSVIKNYSTLKFEKRENRPFLQYC